jgi:glycosyltransferase involved in cell wall biosynthesis
MSPDVSLIMPAWRPRPDWLRAAVGSALDEDACTLELVVVDDGSPDPVAELLADLDDPRLRVIRAEHGGPYAARNVGMTVARGDFLRFVDADDVVERGSTGRLLALARSGDEALAYGATLMCDVDLVPQRTVTSDLEGWVAEACMLGRFEVYIVSMLFPRSVVERVGQWEEIGLPVSGDWDFGLRALELTPVRRLNEIVTRYRRHASSVTMRADVASGAAAGRLVLDRYFERHPDQRGTHLERQAYVRMHLDRARAHAASGQRRQSVWNLAAAARRDPLAVLGVGARRAASGARRYIRRS